MQYCTIHVQRADADSAADAQSIFAMWNTSHSNLQYPPLFLSFFTQGFPAGEDRNSAVLWHVPSSRFLVRSPAL